MANFAPFIRKVYEEVKILYAPLVEKLMKE